VNALILAYWKHVEVYYVKAGKPTSEQSNIRQALRWLRRLYGTTSAAEFRPLALKAVRQTMIDAGHARTTINKNIARIRQVFRWAVANELVPAEVDHGLRTVEGLKRGRCGVRETEPVRPVADELVEHSLRWDVLPVRIAGAKQHAKISLPPILHAKAGPGPLERDGSCPPNRFEPAA
jgi:integrase